MIDMAQELGAQIPLHAACKTLGVPRATAYRHAKPPRPKTPVKRVAINALSSDERSVLMAQLNGERFADQSVNEVWASLIDEGVYLAAPRTMYRVLAANQQVCERRRQLSHPQYQQPELMATAPNQVWSWDITKLRLAHSGQYAFLYVVLDVFSRFVVAWTLADSESAEVAEHLILHACARQKVGRAQLTIHADNGSPMIAHTVRDLLTLLGVTESHSRPHVPNDNPFSESQFKTMKYRPTFPDRFADFDAAQTWAREFFEWYNYVHHHTALKLLTPAVVHAGQAHAQIAKRQSVMDKAFADHPARFAHGRPVLKPIPASVFINPPAPTPGSSCPQLQEVIPGA